MLTWLGAACLAAVATVPLSGTVVDADGHPAAGVSVWLGDTHADHKGPETLATAETDAEGRFQIQRPDDLEGRGASWSPTLWAYKPGFRLAWSEFKWGLPAADEPVRLALEPAVTTPIRVLRPDGSPSVGTRVRPTQMNLAIFNAPRPPDALLDRLTATTDADGRASLDGFAPADLRAVDATVEGELVQTLPLSAGSETVALRPLGRLAVRVVGGDPDAPLKGWRVTVNTRPADPEYSGPFTHWRRETTGDDGRITFEPLAAGRITWDVEPPKGSDYLVSRLPTAMIREGETTEAEIVVLRGVRVEGVVRLAPEGRPIPGIKAELTSFEQTSRASVRVETDAEGRFSAALPPGRCRFSYLAFDMPKDYLIPAGVPSWVDFTTTEGEKLRAVDPPALGRAVRVAGRVVDEKGDPAPGAHVNGTWSVTAAGFQGRATSTSTTTTSGDIHGRFELGRIAPGVEVRVTASRGWIYESDAVIVPKAGEGEPITVQLKRKPTRAVSGRVLDAEGRPLAGALVRVRVRPAAARGYQGGSVFGFEENQELRTDADGRFQTPDQIPTDLDCQIEASAPGWAAGLSNWLTAPAPEAADLRLRRAISARELTGRVVDSFGNPVADAEVLQSLAEPKWERSKTGADGRFTLANVAEAPALVFAFKDGYRFLGRRVEAGERSVDLVLRSFAEPPPAPLRLVPSPVSRDEERTIARALIADARASLADDGRDLGWSRMLDEAEAWVDPDRVVAMIENQARKPEPNLLGAAALGWSKGDPEAILQFLDAIAEPDPAATVALGLFDRLGSSVRPDFRRALLDRAERRAREIPNVDQLANQLVRVADRRFDLGDADRGAALVGEVQKLAPDADPNPFPAARDGLLIPVLARVDLAAALKLLDARAQRPGRAGPAWVELDDLRLQIAKRIAPTDLEAALKLLDSLRPEGARGARRVVRLRLARTNLEAARALGAADDDAFTEALLPAIAARAKAAADPAAARALLRESVDRLAGLDSGRVGGDSPALALARLLPLAARIDPDRARDDLWLALALRPIPPGDETTRVQTSMSPGIGRYFLDLAELAALVARYDRAAAEIVFAPVADRLSNVVEGEAWGLSYGATPALTAAAAYDARTAKALVDGLPDDPPPPEPGEPAPRQTDKLNARIAVARVLGLPPTLRFRAPFTTPPPVDGWVAAIED